jgi:alanine dehydrogenase
MKEHSTLCGWIHCVQQPAMVQAAIDRKITVIAWESMHVWNPQGEKQMHVFYKNNELAGYASVLHMLALKGIDGHYGPRRKVVVIGHGSASRGAIYALQGRGFNNIHVYTRRPTHLVADQNPDAYYHHLFSDADGLIRARHFDGSIRPFIEELAEADIICNGVLQDTNSPVMFLDDSTVQCLKPRAAIIDISCDKGMGFSFAQPTTFDQPTFMVGNNCVYYSIDHAATYLWDAASREISRSFLPYVPIITGGPVHWRENQTINRAIEIKDGKILNRNIISFQNRNREYPHKPC